MLAAPILVALSACATVKVEPQPVSVSGIEGLQARRPVAVVPAYKPSAPPADFCTMPVNLVWISYEAKLDTLIDVAAASLVSSLRKAGVEVAADGPKRLTISVESATCTLLPHCQHTIVLRIVAGSESDHRFTGEAPSGCTGAAAVNVATSRAISLALEKALMNRALRAYLQD